MDSPTHPSLPPSRTKPRSPPSPFSRDNPLIHGHDIELAPTTTNPPFEEQSPNPAPEVFQHHQQQHHHQQQQHSTLEATTKPEPPPPPPPKPHLLPTTYLPDPYAKSWHSNSRPTSPYSHTGAASATTTAPPSAAGEQGQGQRYSYTDFESPFDRRPLVVSPPGEGGKKGVKAGRVCGVGRRRFWVWVVGGVVFVLVAVGVGVGVWLGGRGGENE